MANIIEGIQDQQKRLREEIIPVYESIGVAGKSALFMISLAMKKADEAVATGDTIGMIAAYKDLEGFKL
jgi:hypothetical protein